MRTGKFIELLAHGAGPAPRMMPLLSLGPAMLGGALVAALLSICLLGLVPTHMTTTPALWVKLAYAGLLVASAGWLTARLSLPLSHVEPPRLAIVGVVAVMALLGLATLLAAAPSERAAALFGRTWWRCPLIVAGVALPALAALLWTVRGLAPTRLRGAGFAAGLLAGALGAIGYALHCPEESLAFVAVWYTLGILASGAIGALLGPRMLNW